jgi:hypothetical protein
VAKHTLYLYQDKYTKTIRLEARPQRGRNSHIPLWVAFLPATLRMRTWARQTKANEVELKSLQQHVFFPGYTPHMRNGKFVIDFELPSGKFTRAMIVIGELIRVDTHEFMITLWECFPE